MNTLNINVTYRPIRIGWCIRNDDWSNLRSALELTHTLWGGRYNPLIPVDDPKFASQLVDLFKVDVLYPLSDDKTVQEFIKKFPYLPWPTFDKSLFVDSSPLFLDVRHPLSHLYKDYFQTMVTSDSNAVLFEWEETDPLANVFLTTFGEFPSTELTGIDYRDLFKKNLRSRNLLLKHEKKIPKNAFQRFTINEITRSNISHTNYGRLPSCDNPGFYMGNAKNFLDIVTYWNLRASGIELLFYDPEHADRLEPVIKESLENLRSKKGPKGWKDGIALWACEKVEHLDQTPFSKGLLLHQASHHSWNGLNIQPYKIYLDQHNTLGSISNESNPSVTFQLTKKPFLDDPSFYKQHCVVSMRPVIDINQEELTFFTPYIPELNEYYGREFHFEWDKARVEPDGLGIITHLTNDHLTLRALKTEELVKRLFETFGMKTEASQPGIIAKRLIQQMGGVQDCRVLKIHGVRKLIEKYNAQQSFTKSAAMDKIRRDPKGRFNFAKYEDLVIKTRPRNRKLKPEDAFKFLIEKGVFRVGLMLSCPICNLTFWQHIDNIKTATTCDFCGNAFNITSQLKDRDWAYRRSGIFGRDDHQEGGIPVAVTLQQIDTLLSFGKVVFSNAINILPESANINECESDLFIITQNHDGRVQLVIGECKTSGNISEQDVTNLKKVADAFPEKKIDVFILFAKLDQFNKKEIERCKKAQARDRSRVIMLSVRELEPYDIYEDTVKEYQISRSAVSLKDLAKNTIDIYFDPKPISKDKS